MTTDIATYLAEGCGRCSLGGTPQCKAVQQVDILKALREIVLGTGLEETVKWGSPCYTLSGKNVVMVSAMKTHCVVSFMKGVLLDDPHGLLEKPGPNSTVGKVMRFASVEEVVTHGEALQDYLQAAIAVEKSGKKVPKSSPQEKVPEELHAALEADPALKSAFEALTPGRQRGYILQISAAKQSKTRQSRIAKYTPMILAGKGLHDR
ncbi:YdeI/OmpD-associated family protein [Marinoscillum furvescens]|nr:YdeI/OmpD-associated family protein [Marinoscillum furvescens]